jgi:hypothetical protein
LKIDIFQSFHKHFRKLRKLECSHNLKEFNRNDQKFAAEKIRSRYTEPEHTELGCTTRSCEETIRDEVQWMIAEVQQRDHRGSQGAAER